MAVYWTAGLVALFYLMALPVRAGAAWRTHEDLRLGIMIGIFRISVRIRLNYVPAKGFILTLIRREHARIHEFNLSDMWAKRDHKPKHLIPISRGMGYLRTHIHPHHLNIYLHFSQSDAAQNAFLYGICDTILSTWHAICPALPLNASVGADFRAEGTQIDFSGILQCRLGHIITAGLIVLRDFLIRRFHTWTTSNPSKAS